MGEANDHTLNEANLTVQDTERRESLIRTSRKSGVLMVVGLFHIEMMPSTVL